MAVGAIGSVIYANQMMPAQAAKQMEYQNSVQMQSELAAAMAGGKDEEVQEVRPAEETYKIDPENEHQKQRNDEEQKEGEQKESKKEDDEFTHRGLLDIKA